MPSRIRSIAAHTANRKLAASKLHAALAARFPGFIGLRVKGDVLVILFDSAPSAQDESDLDAELAAHDGQPVPRFKLLASSKLIIDEKEITQTASWEDLSGAVLSFGFFLSDVTRALCRVVGQIKTTGAGVELRVVKADGTSLNSQPYRSRDTAGAWQNLQVSTDQPPNPRLQLYRLQGRLNGATSASIRFVDLALLQTR